MELYFINPDLTPHLKEQMTELGIVSELPFTLDQDFKYDPEINNFLWSLPSPGRLSPRTWATYSQSISMYMRYLEASGIHWKEATKEDLINYHRLRRHTTSDAIKSVSSSTWKLDITAIAMLYTWAYDKGLISALPFKLEDTSVPSGVPMSSLTRTDLHERPRHKDIKFIHIDDFKEIILPELQRRRNSVRDTALALLLISTGMRIEEAHDLKLTQIPDPDSDAYTGRKSCSIKIKGKGSKIRTIPIPKHVLRDIHHYIDNERADACDRYLRQHSRRKYAPDYLFLTQSGNRPAKRTLQYIFGETGRTAGIHLTPHMLRHTYAIFQLSSMIRTSLSSQNEKADNSDLGGDQSVFHDPLRQLQRLMGHSHISTTFIYLDYLDDVDEMIDNAVDEWTETLYQLA